jgi:serine protease Do
LQILSRPTRGRTIVSTALVVWLLLSLVSRALAQHLWTESPQAIAVHQGRTLPDFADLVQKLSPAVVNISSSENLTVERDLEAPGGLIDKPDRDAKSLGSGFLINGNGYVLTNQHVVSDADQIVVTTQDGHAYKGRLIGSDRKSDIALVKIDPARALPTAPLGNSDDVRVGEWVIAIGNPFGFDHSVTAGIVSAKGRFIPDNYDEFIQTDASINPGNSGGPLINLRGEVIGVNSAIYTRTGTNTGISFAIPVNLVKEEIEQLQTSGRIVRGWLGVKVIQVTQAAAEANKMADLQGALVAEVMPSAPAQIAGVHPQDIIVAFDNRPISDSMELPLVVGHTPIGQKVKLKLLRNGKPLEISATIVPTREEAYRPASAKAGRSLRGTPSPVGAYVKDLTPQLASELNLGETSGVVVASVADRSAAQRAGLRRGDLILEVNRQGVKDVGSYEDAIRQALSDAAILLLVKRDGGTIYLPLDSKG